WQRQPQRTPPPRGNRLYTFLGILAAIGVLLWVLHSEFPGALQTQADIAWVFYLSALGALLASGFVASRRVSAQQVLTNIAIWLVVVAVIAAAYIMKESSGDLIARLKGNLMPGYGVETAPHAYTITADDNGSFVAFGKVNGATVRFTIDTGASDVVLSPDDARRAGIDVSTLTFGGKFESANGTGHSAFVTLDTLSVGPISFVQVPASITQRNMNGSLLGMAFLKRLKSFEFAGNKLILRW
ncbi:MAG TPA: TIGR02281 family clan AA aspartic protease, partial [Rhizomicrobium sp.]|nr:TIGR02281 family clan AA aspartic protease [Rhizomicrobium sp.]